VLRRAALVLVAAAALAGASRGVSTAAPSARTGRAIWQHDCAVCHGSDASGSFRGPDLRASGTADIDFMVRSGRMPVADPSDGTSRRRTRYTASEIDALVSYSERLVDGPRPQDVDVAAGDVANGAKRYQEECAACHQAAGAGGALAFGTVAPKLTEATPIEVVEAMRVGPGSMPVFPSSLLSDDDARDVAAYVDRHLRPGDDPGGLSLWHLGPVPEGLVAWVVGIGALLLVCRALGDRDKAPTD
jgi:ubiquinol-cytochrome c reductase cytochrome c subunit